MQFIIFGFKNQHNTIGSGEFYCPQCRAMRTYEHKESRRYFTLYFFPIFPISSPVEFVQCKVCDQGYTLEVLRHKKKVEEKSNWNPNLAGMLNTIKERLAQGEPADYAIRDLTAAGLNLDVAKQMINPLLKPDYKFCQTCGLTYTPNVQTCKECGNALITKKNYD